MSGLTVQIRPDGANLDLQAALDSLNPLGSFATKSWQSPSAILATSYPSQAPSTDKRFYEDVNFVGMFAGDIVNADLLNWADIGESLADDTRLLETLRGLKGSFVLTVYDVKEQVLWAATDSFGFQSLYFQVKDDAVSISTSIGSFLRGPDASNKHAVSWIYQYLFFHNRS